MQNHPVIPFVRILLLLGAVFVVFAALPALAQECMDCTQRVVQRSDTYVVEGECCMAFSGHCFEKDYIVDLNVGFGCRVGLPNDQGSTKCESDKLIDKDCKGGGGGGNKNGQSTFLDEGGSCAYNQYGWCDAGCAQCSWG
jgi:hypothetical protein